MVDARQCVSHINQSASLITDLFAQLPD